MTVEIIERSFNCSESPLLSLSNIRGSVNIQAGQINQITITARKNLSSGDAENTQIEIHQAADGSVKASTRYDKSGFRFHSSWRPCKVDYEVFVPENCELKIRGVSNSATIAGISGRMNFTTVSGDLDLHDLTGDFKFRTVSGDIKGESLSGPLKMEAVTGDIKFEGSNFPTIKGKTVSGDLLIESPLGDGPYQFKGVSGDIKIFTPEAGGATIHTSSLSGNIRTKSQTLSSGHTRGKRVIDIRGGGTEISHHSVSGDFFLIGAKNNGDPIDSNQDKMAIDPPLSRSEILDRISSGELSANEALELLENHPAD